MAVIQDKDSALLLGALVQHGYRATKLASTGGFLRAGNTTLLIGVDNEQVDSVVTLIKEISASRERLVTPMPPVGGTVESYVPYPVEVIVGGATIFVLDVEHFERV